MSRHPGTATRDSVQLAFAAARATSSRSASRFFLRPAQQECRTVRTPGMRRLWIFSALGLLVAATPVAPQVPDGYFVVDSMPELPLDTTETLAGGRHSIRIDRRVAPEDLGFVIRAEQMFPSSDLIEADVADFLEGRGGNWPRSFQEARDRPGPRWWWRTFDEVPIPWAVTGHTARDLAATVRRFATEPLSFFSPGTEVEFSYVATVEAGENGTRRVTLTAVWKMSCGSLCGLWFQHQRVVTFDSDGAVVEIQGDGRPSYIVS